MSDLRQTPVVAPMPYSVFLATDYRKYTTQFCDYHGDVRGLRSQLAAAAKCQPSRLCSVLAEEAHFSLDQLYGVSNYMQLGEREWEYFNLLWQHARAGSHELRDKIIKQMKDLRLSHSSAIGGPSVVDRTKKWDRYSRFASTWHHSAVYVVLEIPGVETAAAISVELKLKEKRVTEILGELEEMELVQRDGNGWKQTTNSFVMDRRSPIFQIHRMHWTALSMQKFHDDPMNGYHGGICFAVGEKQLRTFEEKVQHLIYDILKHPIDPDKPDGDAGHVAYLGVDLFRI